MTFLMGLKDRLSAARLQIITSLAAHGRGFADFAAECAQGGADILVVDVAGVKRSVAVGRLEQARAAVRQHTLIAVSDDVAVAAEFVSDAVLVDATASLEGSRPPSHPWALVGRHLADPAALTGGIDGDWVVLEPAATDALTGLGGEVARRLPAAGLDSPRWFLHCEDATPDDVTQLAGVGVRRISVGRAVTGATNPMAVVTALQDVLTEVWVGDPQMDAYLIEAMRRESGLGGDRT